MLRLFVLSLALLACDKTDASDDKPKKKSKTEEGVKVSDYCDKMLELDEKTAKANGAKIDDKEALAMFCQGMFGNAKKKEPEAYACMADCMMDAESREDEQKCISKKKCLAKASNPKLFSNRKD